MGPRPEHRRPPPAPAPVYLRFVCFRQVEGQRNRLGLFQAIEVAEAVEDAPAWALTEFVDLDRWFTKNLKTPTRFARGSRKRPGERALSWFKPTAVEHIRQMHRLKAALEECGIHVEELATRDPGRIIYEDEHQITAEPLGGRF